MKANEETASVLGSRAIVIAEVVAMGGAERSCLGLSRWLYEHGLDHHIVTYYDRIDLASYAAHPVKVVQLKPAMRPWSKIAALGSHLRGMQSPFQSLQSGYQPALHATLAGVRGFHTLMHDTPSLIRSSTAAKPPRQRIYDEVSQRILGNGLRSGGRTIVASRYLQKETLDVFHVAADLLPIGGQPRSSSFMLRPVGDSFRMISVSRVAWNKRLDWIIRALASLEHGAHPLSTQIDWRFDIIGEGPQMGDLREMIEQMQLSGRIVLHGYLSDEQLQPLMDTANLMLMPARQGYGIPALEALQSGIPVLLHRESGISDLLLETAWATVFNGGEPELRSALAEAIEEVKRGSHLNEPLPYLPTEDAWAEQVVDLCGWR